MHKIEPQCPVSTLVLDEEAVKILDSALIEDEWFESFEIPPDSPGIRRVKFGDVVYIISRLEDISRVLIINVGDKGVFHDGGSKRTTLSRILRVATRHFDRGVNIPSAWQVYHDGSRLSIYAATLYKSSFNRIYFEQSPRGDDNIYAFTQTERPEDLDKVGIDYKNYDDAIEKYLDAVGSVEEFSPEVGMYGILLTEPLGKRLSTPGTLTDWHERLLSPEQRDFVNRDHKSPVRLRGAAGTGKTQAMVVKTLWDLYQARAFDQTVAFLTHSSALAHDVGSGLIAAARR
ncbi:hypothetical protein M3P36_12475 [Altererythrobacter sp. KTW20L]|uniref:hypothetical protein n=1 Tax=Altererythrobacter sp. KTW20L TaxID=2942210 RepID=UPI0020C088E8|nr:hypothetical protein [Altererythrobacter sp. KTW20L]MCL6251853.1 hypothetical protein [Altererythrobacter sp. KTW20L]